jgi:uncharacterized protein YgiB involved in biofilm formation
VAAPPLARLTIDPRVAAGPRRALRAILLIDFMPKNFEKSRNPMHDGDWRKPRKRSHTVTLALMGTGAVAGVGIGLWLWHSSSGVDGGVYRNVEQCVEGRQFDRDACAAGFAEAQRHHEEMAPRYANAADCEADFTPGECQPMPSGTGDGKIVYAPIMAGVLLGSALGVAAMPAVQPLYRRCANDPNDPNFATDRCSRSSGGSHSGGAFYSCSGYRVASSYGSARVAPAAFSTAGASRTTMSRGGFGARAASAAG